MAFRLAEIAERVGAQLNGDGAVEITGVAPIEKASAGEISFVANRRYEKHIATTGASALVLDPHTPCDRIPSIRHENPYLTMAHVVDLLYPEKPVAQAGRHPSAVIDSAAEVDPSVAIGALAVISGGATIGQNTQIAPSVFIGEDVNIGEDCRIYPGARILRGCKIGNRVIIHPGVVVGSDGFGFAESPTGLKKIQQVGWVEIDDDVEIGSNTTIDRGAIGPTRIGRGTKIDNLVQIAHNVEIGQHCIIVSQVGISGSTKLGNQVILAGQVGLVGHIELGDGVKVGAQSGVKNSVPAGKTIFGYPARDIMEAKRIEACLNRLPELLKRVKSLEKGQSEKSGGE
jgi:UDP-3-O-[3-hydroxymyristoyl] glucosamine N-acyltransferase